MSAMSETEVKFYKAVGRRIRAYRKWPNGRSDDRKLLTQAQLADCVGLGRTSIANIEAGRQRVMLHHLYAIAEWLDVEPFDLIPPLSGPMV